MYTFKKLIYTLSHVLIVWMTFSCKKDENPKAEEPSVFQTEVISGKVMAPAGMNSEGWKVNSTFDEQVVSAGNYSLNVQKNGFSIQYVSDEGNRTLLMGLKYPGQTNFDISAQSTVIAMLLQMPAVMSLNEAGKLNLINSIQSSPEFSPTVITLEDVLKSGSDLFDTTSSHFQQKLATLFQDAALRPGSSSTANVNILRSGKNLIFQNSGKPFMQVIGIYNGSQRIAKIELDRYKYLISSLTDLLTLDDLSNPIEKPFTLTNDGFYNIRIRSGFLNYGDPESSEAFILNSAAQVNDFALVLLGDLLGSSCFTGAFVATAADVTSAYQAYSGISGVVLFQKVFYDAALLTTKRIGSLLEKCSKNPGPAGINYLKKTENLLFFLKAFSITSSYLNTGNFLYHYYTSPSAQDTCFRVTNNTVGLCTDTNSSKVTDIDGNQYQTVKIGTQTWMKSNLKTTRYRNGVAIPTGFSDSQWINAGPAYAVYNNETANNAYGKLYNWYAVKNQMGLCPAGWHVPNDAEWNIIRDYLGGYSVAGGKMKAVSGLWLAPNTGADNSSGFTALPGGFRSYDGGFYRIGEVGWFWSSDEYSLDRANLRQLNNNESHFYKWDNYKTVGLSVRCIKD